MSCLRQSFKLMLSAVERSSLQRAARSCKGSSSPRQPWWVTPSSPDPGSCNSGSAGSQGMETVGASWGKMFYLGWDPPPQLEIRAHSALPPLGALLLPCLLHQDDKVRPPSLICSQDDHLHPSTDVRSCSGDK